MIIKREDFGNIEAYCLTNEKSGEFVEIISGFGAVINKYMIENGSGLNSITDGYETEDDLINNCLKVFKGVKLFPFTNRIRNGNYKFKGNDYQLYINFPHENNSIHGLLLDKKFDVVQANSNDYMSILGLQYRYDKNEKGFPFVFDLRLNFIFTKDSNLRLETIITNPGTDSLPVVDGWHPYFTFGKQIDDIQLELPSEYVLEVDEQMIPNGRFTEYNDFNKIKKIGPTNFDNCFKMKLTEYIVKTRLIDLSSMSGIEVWQEVGDKRYNYAQIYIPPSRKSIAVEPMTGPPDAFNSGKDLVVLESSGILKLVCGINIIKKPRQVITNNK